MELLALVLALDDDRVSIDLFRQLLAECGLWDVRWHAVLTSSERVGVDSCGMWILPEAGNFRHTPGA